MLTARGRTLLERWIYVLVLADGAFVCPYTEARLAALRGDAGYGADFAAFLERFLAALAGGPWAPGSYYPGGWYRRLQARGEAPARAPVTPGALGPFYQDELRVDRQGRWFVGRKAITGRVLQHFLRNLHYDAELGRYVIRYALERHTETRYLHHESPPVRVRRVTHDGGAVTLRLNTGRSEPLRPETLRLDGAEQLYCAVGEEQVPAWFEEPARWELLKDAEERDGTWVLSLGGRTLAPPLHAAWTYADGLPA
jgi:hypothetical protein